MNRRRWIGVAAVLSVLMSVGLAIKSIQDFRRPFRLWMGDVPRWYDDAMGAAMYAVVATACVVYLVRTRRSGPLSRWRDRIELRVVLYCLAGMLALQFPLGIVQAVRALIAGPRTWATFLWVFPVGALVFPAVAFALVMYDRRRIRRDWKESGACEACGYDLTGNTSGTCPECGAPVRSVRAGA